jgi:hypothetical protein
MGQDRGGGAEREGGLFRGLLDELEAVVATACESRDTWPEQVGAGIYAGVDFAIDHPAVAEAFAPTDRVTLAPDKDYQRVIERLAGLISRDAPSESRLPGRTDEALVAGIIGLVGDHLRVGRFEALRELRPDLVLLALLPYLGFEGAQGWANKLAQT